MFSADMKKLERIYRRVLNKLIETLKTYMDPEAVLDGLVKHEIGGKNIHMNIQVSENLAIWNKSTLDNCMKIDYND